MDSVLWISELILQNQPSTFAELTELVRERARAGDRILRMAIKPPYPATPEHWEVRIESTFSSHISNHTGQSKPRGTSIHTSLPQAPTRSRHHQLP